MKALKNECSLENAHRKLQNRIQKAGKRTLTDSRTIFGSCKTEFGQLKKRFFRLQKLNSEASKTNFRSRENEFLTAQKRNFHAVKTNSFQTGNTIRSYEFLSDEALGAQIAIGVDKNRFATNSFDRFVALIIALACLSRHHSSCTTQGALAIRATTSSADVAFGPFFRLLWPSVARDCLPSKLQEAA